MGHFKINSLGKVLSNSEAKSEIMKDTKSSKDMENKKKFNTVNVFAKQVLEKMKKDDVLPSPINYQNYFEKMLMEKSQSQRESIEEILRLENDNEIEKEYMYKVDIYLNDSFKKTKKLLDNVRANYARINKIKNFIKTKGNELTKNLTPTSIKSFESKLSQALDSLSSEQEKIKEEFFELTQVIKEFNAESIFEKKYGVYNKKYLFEVLKNELSNLKNLDYKNSLVAFRVSEDILKSIKLNSDKDLVIKTVAKIIMDRSRRSDVLAHYEDGIFLLLLKHTRLNEAKKAVESIKNYVSFSNFIIDSTPIQAKIDAFVVEMNADMSVDEIISDAVKGLLK